MYKRQTYASGQRASYTIKKLDAISHQAMKDMGFRRTYGGQIENIDTSVKRYISRYTMLYTGKLLDE